jgi:hypothetical protein
MPRCPDAPVTMPSLVHSAIWLQSLIFLSGCAESTVISSLSKDPVSAVSAERSASERTFDAGMFFIDEPSYLCIPFERLGISEDRVVVSVTSSCDCIKPSVVKYRNGEQGSKSAIRLSLIAIDDAVNKHSRPVSLGVNVIVRYDDDQQQVFVVNFQHAEVSV